MSKQTLKQKIDLLTAIIGKLAALYLDHAKTMEETVTAIADDLHTFNANAEQRFNAMHLEHDLIIDMLSRIHGLNEKPNDM